MPYRMKKESSGKGIVLTFSGIVTGEEMNALHENLRTDELLSKLRYQIWDFSGIEDIKVSFEELRNYAMHNSAEARKDPDKKLAIIIRTKLSSGLDSMFHAYEKAWGGYESETFTDIDAARKWAQSD
jgi:hypothetical protein